MTDVSENNIIELIIGYMEDVEQLVDKTGVDKKAFVMNSIKDIMGQEAYNRYRYFIGITIDFIVKVSKKEIKLNLNNIKKKCFICI